MENLLINIEERESLRAAMMYLKIGPIRPRLKVSCDSRKNRSLQLIPKVPWCNKKMLIMRLP